MGEEIIFSLCQFTPGVGGVPWPGPARGMGTLVRFSWRGTPARSRWEGGVPWPGPTGGLPGQVQPGGYPGQVQPGGTLVRSRRGVPQPGPGPEGGILARSSSDWRVPKTGGYPYGQG